MPLSASGRLSATISTLGAALVDLTWQDGDDKPRPLVIDPDNAPYDRQTDPAYIGVVVGRTCGRIRNGRYVLSSGDVLQLPCNHGDHHLHGGGPGALSHQIWEIVARTENAVQMRCISASGSEGYPGHFEAEIIYTLIDNRLEIALQAVCDAPGPINLTLHPYFNLSAEPKRPATDQALQIQSDKVCTLDSDLVPTGERYAVAGTPFDFRHPKPVNNIDLDTIYLLDTSRPASRPAARLISPDADLALEVLTDRAALVAYDGSGLEAPLRAAGGGVCLEPQDPPGRNGPTEHSAGVPWLGQITFRVRSL